MDAHLDTKIFFGPGVAGKEYSTREGKKMLMGFRKILLYGGRGQGERT